MCQMTGYAFVFDSDRSVIANEVKQSLGCRGIASELKLLAMTQTLAKWRSI